ncbi:hypothetical protein [Streptomyces sp. NPDC087859]|uniref:hypothetical protein n=1 Tax=Streptomyces sp. NPDC087859 TaxID=3365812 RepID=UPI0037FB690C
MAHDIARVCRTAGLGRMPVTDDGEHRRASGDRDEHSLSGHRDGPGGVFGQGRFPLGCVRGGALPLRPAADLTTKIHPGQ